ncbi:MAG: hypothetical protein QM817_16185 [Archangium sp.]
MTCPWDAFDPATISFCEARLCEAVVEPANAFTSLSKTLVGLWLIPRAVRARVPALWAIVIAALLQGPLGFALHATGTFWGEALDVSGMFLISGTLLAFAASRRFGWPPVRTWLLLVASSVALLLVVRPSGIPVFTVQIVAWLALEVRPGANRWLRWMIGVFAVGFAFWLLDKTRVACDPNNHFVNGHAVWHLATSACLALFFEYESALARK